MAIIPAYALVPDAMSTLVTDSSEASSRKPSIHFRSVSLVLLLSPSQISFSIFLFTDAIRPSTMYCSNGRSFSFAPMRTRYSAYLPMSFFGQISKFTLIIAVSMVRCERVTEPASEKPQPEPSWRVGSMSMKFRYSDFLTPVWRLIRRRVSVPTRPKFFSSISSLVFT